MHNRANKNQQLVDYIEERWPSLEFFAADNPHDEYGYANMAEVALAYSRTGNRERFDEALMLVENAMSKLSGEGINDFVFMVENAKYLVLAGKYDEALTALERGMKGFAPLAADVPMFEPLKNDPRFVAVEATMVVNINAERKALGLEPIGSPKQL